MAKQRKAKITTDGVTSPKLIASVEELRQTLGIQFWDVLLVGDGSGSGWDIGTGWSCVLLDRFSWHSKLFWGAINTGTVTIGELFPYLHAMMWYFSGDGPGKDRLDAVLSTGRAMQVHVVTDNASVALGGNNPESRRANLEIWCGIDHICSRGVSMVFHHWRRDNVSLNILADEVSRQSRLAVEASYGKAIEVLGRKYPGIPADAKHEDFFLWGPNQNSGTPPA